MQSTDILVIQTVSNIIRQGVRSKMMPYMYIYIVYLVMCTFEIPENGLFFAIFDIQQNHPHLTAPPDF